MNKKVYVGHIVYSKHSDVYHRRRVVRKYDHHTGQTEVVLSNDLNCTSYVKEDDRVEGVYPYDRRPCKHCFRYFNKSVEIVWMEEDASQ